MKNRAIKPRIRAKALPPLPQPDADGNFPAVDYGRASIARGIIRDRVAAGLTQRELAKRAGVRVETLCRIQNRSAHAVGGNHRKN
jgi:hypothetical protein